MMIRLVTENEKVQILNKLYTKHNCNSVCILFDVLNQSSLYDFFTVGAGAPDIVLTRYCQHWFVVFEINRKGLRRLFPLIKSLMEHIRGFENGATMWSLYSIYQSTVRMCIDRLKISFNNHHQSCLVPFLPNGFAFLNRCGLPLGRKRPANFIFRLCCDIGGIDTGITRHRICVHTCGDVVFDPPIIYKGNISVDGVCVLFHDEYDSCKKKLLHLYGTTILSCVSSERLNAYFKLYFVSRIKIIQKHLRQALFDPYFRMCKNRLIREFNGLSTISGDTASTTGIRTGLN